MKLVVPQDGYSLEALEKLDFKRYSLQPMDGPDLTTNTMLAIELVRERPNWQLSLQTHKITGIR